MLEWIIENKEVLKLIYTLAIVAICAVIVLKTDRLFKISSHQGIRYLRNAFLFYGAGFMIRRLAGLPYLHFRYMNILFEFLMVMAGFFLLYSLLWKKVETRPNNYTSSLFNPWMILFYSMALLISIVDNLWSTYIFMFASQILLFLSASIISFKNYLESGAQYKFLKFYFFAMLLSLAAWTLNAFASLYFEWNQLIVLDTYILNIVIFLLFLFGVVQVTKK